MYQILEAWSNLRKKSDFFLVKVGIYKVTYPQNSGYNTNHKYGKDIDCKNDIAIQYQRKESENPGMFRYFFLIWNIVIDVW